MANMALNQVVRCVIVSRMGGQNGINVRHYRVSAVAGGVVTDLEVATALSSLYAAAIKPILPTVGNYEGMLLQIIKPAALPTVRTNIGNGAGVQAFDPLPPGVSGLMKLSTAAAGRHGRGRLYIPFPNESNNDTPGKPNAGYQTGVLPLVAVVTNTQIITGITLGTATLVPVVFNRSAGTTIDIVTATVRNAWATQRRRSFLKGGDVSPI